MRMLTGTMMAGIAATGLGWAAFGGSAAPPSAAAPVVVELFTSQGCSSCPPADAVLARLAADPGVVAISRPVTYWDRLGWKDTLARPANTALQAAYAARLGGGSYTPEIVVGGRAGVVGSREGEVRRLIAAQAFAAAPRLAVTRTGGGARVTLAGAGSGQVILIAFAPRVAVSVANGENGGRRIVYSNVLRAERVLGEWRGGQAGFAVPQAALAGAGEGHAVIVRQGDAGPILAGRYL